MNFRKDLPSIEEIKNTDIVDYLQRLGFQPVKIHQSSYWYLSPLRDEKVPSFKVNRNINRWYDFGEGKGGNIIDFGILYHACTVSDLLKKINNSFSFRQQTFQPNQEEEKLKRISVINAKAISSLALIQYLHKRRIPLGIANEFCKEINYELYSKRYYALGFKNDAGGYELRNEKFKGSSSPKDITLIKNNAEDLAMFEGFFNFLSFIAIHQNKPQPKTDFLILNSTSFFERSFPLMLAYKCKHLYLDCDTTGQKCIQKVQALDDRTFIDESVLYKDYKDLNELLLNIGRTQKQGMHLKP